MQPQLSIIIVNWNTRPYLEACLSSIREVIPRRISETIVVDNASDDDSVAFVRRSYQDLMLIANDANRGFSGGVNAGLGVARGEFILILNPDIVLRAGVVESLIDYLQRNPDVGAAMPLLRNLDGSEQQGYVRRIPTLRQVFWFYTALDRFSFKDKVRVEQFLFATIQQGTLPVEVPQIPGAFIMTRKEVLADVGLWDESYKLFFEDVDWCDRLLAHGKRLVMLPWIEATHIGGKSFETASQRWLTARFSVSLVNFFLKRRGWLHALVVAGMLGANACFGLMKNVARYLFLGDARRRESIEKIAKYAGILRLFARAFVLGSDNQVMPTR